MKPVLAARAAELEIDLACRTMLAVAPGAMRTITVVLADQGDFAATTACLATTIAERYGLDAIISSGRGFLKVRLVRRVRAASASPARR